MKHDADRRRIYVASSWRNLLHPGVVAALRKAGHEVYDFRNPKPGDDGFRWSEIDGGWRSWTPERYREALQHPIAIAGFSNDWDAMRWADTCVLVLPCGRSAHLEAGYFVGAGKDLFIFQPDKEEPELMYRMARRVCVSMDELFDSVGFDDE